MAFLRNTWYVAAWSDEVPESGMLHRRLLGEDVLIMRDAERAPRALLNRCPHRFAPLQKIAFEEQDKPMVIAQRDALAGADFWDMKPLILAGDAGAVKARRLLRNLVKEEQGSVTA
jgi:Vanillate O-demethylase oxygenase C-terminal domain/Rieske [2Fe-2S] domain